MRDLRSARAEDIIYAGPRRMLGAAEVALTFEDAGGDGMSLWSGLCVSRRLFRSGESEYLINRSKARLRDVLSALREVGIDASRHVVVTQGMADALLSATPVERRGLLEHAAGLSGYRERREDARQKLATTQRNVETIEVILAELEPRVRLLRRQARAVEEREEAVGRLRAALTDWYASKWRSCALVREEAAAEAQRVASQRHAIAQDLSRVESLSEASLEHERAWNRQVEAVVEALHSTTRELDLARAQVRQAEGRLSLALETLDRLEIRAAQLERSVADARQRRDWVVQSLEETRDQQADWQRQSSATQVALQRALGELQDRTRSTAERRRDFDAAKERETELVGRQREVHASLEMEARLAEGVEEWLRESSRLLEHLAADLQACERNRLEVDRSLRQQEAALGEAEETLRQQSSRMERLRRVTARGELMMTELSRRDESLRRQVIVLESELDTRLLASLHVAPGWEVAVSVALGEWALAADGNSLGLTLHPGSLSDFLAWREQLGLSLDGAVWADSLVFGFPADRINPLCGTLLVEGELEAEQIWARLESLPAFTLGSPPVQVVTRDGGRWDAVGSRPAPRDDRAARYLRLKHEVARLEIQRPVLERRLEGLRHEYETACRLVKTAEAVSRAAHEETQQWRRRLEDLVDAQDRLTRRRAGLQTERREQMRRRAQHRAREEEHRASLAALQGELAEQAEAVARGEARWRDAHAAGRDARRRVEALEDRRRDIDRSLVLVRTREAAQTEQFGTLEVDLTRLAAETADVIAAQRELVDDRTRIQEERDRHVATVGQLETVVEEQSLRVAEVRAQRPRVEDRAPILRELRERLSTSIARHERSLANLAQTDRAGRELAAEIWRELEMDADALPDNVESAPTDDEIRRLRARAVQYADAEPSIVEEYRAMRDRYEHLRRHVEDLKAAAENLERIMTSADREMRARFGSAFVAVNDEFSRVFRMMLQGGDARLEQVDDDGGIEVRAQLPGRRTRSSTAFSGGERALVASSLLFGVLRIRPTPFCILDEVDAALDESNVDRYLEVLRDISRSTQVLMVTHNRATMAVADVLYGLTMDDEGVSNVLSLRLDTYGAAS